MKREEIAQLLPTVFQRTLSADNPLTGLLEVMEVLHEPSEAVLAHLDAILDPRRTTDKFVPYLAYWADLTRLFADDSGAKDPRALTRAWPAGGLGHLRELIANAAYLSQWRGTKKGLLLFLQTATGITDFVIDENVDLEGKPKPFHISVHAPKESELYRQLIDRIVSLEKPAFVTYEISFATASS
jgi:phage tail-like protein